MIGNEGMFALFHFQSKGCPAGPPLMSICMTVFAIEIAGEVDRPPDAKVGERSPNDRASSTTSFKLMELLPI
jgi:hypothetical protein